MTIAVDWDVKNQPPPPHPPNLINVTLFVAADVTPNKGATILYKFSNTHFSIISVSYCNIESQSVKQ